MRRALAIAAIVVGLSGCGSSGPTTEQLRTRASAICTAAARQTGAIPTPILGAVEPFLARGEAVLRVELGRLRALQPPAASATRYRRALDTVAQEVGELERTRAELARGADQVDTVRALQRRLGALESESAAAWRALDIPACRAT